MQGQLCGWRTCRGCNRSRHRWQEVETAVGGRIAGPHIAFGKGYRRSNFLVEPTIRRQIAEAKTCFCIPGSLDSRQNMKDNFVIGRSTGIENQSRPCVARRSFMQKADQLSPGNGYGVPQNAGVLCNDDPVRREAQRKIGRRRWIGQIDHDRVRTQNSVRQQQYACYHGKKYQDR